MGKVVLIVVRAIRFLLMLIQLGAIKVFIFIVRVTIKLHLFNRFILTYLSRVKYFPSKLKRFIYLILILFSHF